MTAVHLKSSKVRSRNDKQNLYEDIRRRIISMDLAPGEDLDELGLVATYGVSRTPVRETLIRLTGEGLVEMRPNRGAYVAPLDITVLQSYFEAADFIHRAMARLAALRRTETDLDKIVEAKDSFEAALRAENTQDMVIWNDSFHDRIGLAARNKYIYAAYRRLLADHERIAALLYGHEVQDHQEEALDLTLQQHNDLTQAIIEKDPQTAEKIASEHLAFCKDGLASTMARMGDQLSDLAMR